MKRLALFVLLLLATQIGFAQIEYVENKGQWHNDVLYKANLNSGAIFLENSGFTMLLENVEDVKKRHDYFHNTTPQKSKPFTFHSFVYKVKFEGSNPSAQIIHEKPFDGELNYFLGNDRNKWASGCKSYQTITYKDIYRNIDLRYYSDKGSVKYEFVVNPGADFSQIKIKFDGPESIDVIDKELHIKTPAGNVKEPEPYSYLITKNGRKTVSTPYIKISKNIVSFAADKIDRSVPLVIDPTIIFSTFSGSTTDNWGYTATPGADGSMYIGGIVFGSGYQVSPGAYDVTFNGQTTNAYDVAIMKLNSNGSQRIYATYLGGVANEQPHSLIEDYAGNLIIAGRTNSSNFPSTARQGPGGMYDIFVSKLNATGSSLTGSIIIGGSSDDGVNIQDKEAGGGAISLRRNYGDDARSEVIMNSSNEVFLASCTKSRDILAGTTTTIQNTFGGMQDGLIVKLTPALNISFISFFGGQNNDAAFVIDINPINQNLYIAGVTASSDLPGSKTGTIGPNFFGGEADGFVTIIPQNGSAIIKTSYFGTSTLPTSIDLIYGIKFDRLGFPYILGTSTGNWPILNAVYSNIGAKHFISKIRPDLSSYVYSTVFGKPESDPCLSPVAFLVDRCENVYMSGWGGGANVSGDYTTSNTLNLPEVNPLSGIPPADGRDFYFFVLEKNASNCLFASHFGDNGATGDHVDGGTSRFDENGFIYQGLCANCDGSLTYPTTPGVVYPRNGTLPNARCNQGALKILMNYAGVVSDVIADTVKGCTPLTVKFNDGQQQAVKYYYYFGDGSPVFISQNPQVTHTFNQGGTFQVMQIAEDSSKCNIRDTSYITIISNNKKAAVDFSFVKIPPCSNLTYSFTNLSQAQNATFTAQSFQWNFGDGSAPIIAGTGSVNHTYAAPGNYIVTLTLLDTVFCRRDSVKKTVRVNPDVKARFTVGNTGCAPDSIHLINNSLGADGFIWQFDDGTVFSTDENPVIYFAVGGTYKIRLIATNPNACNFADTSAYQTIVVASKPVAAFTFAPNPPVSNTPIQFTNQSTGATSYLWDFGDGTTSSLTNPEHQYTNTDTFKVKLYAYNDNKCVDSVSMRVPALVSPLLDLPNAFTPGRNDRNSIIYVRGFAVKDFKWNIYNRWGELVFTTNSVSVGWDGTYKGKPQPMDVYAYTIEATMGDGEKVKKSGDITLIR